MIGNLTGDVPTDAPPPLGKQIAMQIQYMTLEPISPYKMYRFLGIEQGTSKNQKIQYGKLHRKNTLISFLNTL